jgi:hypothetical protein
MDPSDKMNMSVLEKKYVEPERPYSHKELADSRNRMIRYLRIGQVLIDHPDCKHFYFARANGRKEKEAKESNGEVIGNCSVCWKMNRTPKKLRNTAKLLCDSYMESNPAKFNPPASSGYLELETDFYTWLYNEFNPVEDEKRVPKQVYNLAPK